MGWVIPLYQPLLDHGYKTWANANAKTRSIVTEKTSKRIQNAHEEATRKGKTVPSLPKEVNKVCIPKFIQKGY
jgi:hypothetical protein